MTLRETLEQIRAVQQPLPSSEEATKVKIILPLLRGLGWDPEGPDVDYEYPIGDTNDKPDIALLHHHQIVAFVEAKKAGQNLATPSQIDQIRRYFSNSDATICALTNGTEWWLYVARGAEGNDEFKFAKLRLLDDPIEELEQDLTMFLRRDNLTRRRGEAVTNQALKVLRARIGDGLQPDRLDTLWHDMLNRASDGCLDNDLVILFRRHVYKRSALRPTPEQIAALLREQRRTDGPRQPLPAQPAPSRPPSDPPTAPPETSTAQAPWNEPAQPNFEITKIIGYELTGPPSKPYTELANNYELLTGVALDIFNGGHSADFSRIKRLGMTHGRPYASTIPEELDPGGKRPANRRPVGRTGWFVNTNLTHDRLEERVRQFLEHFDYDPDDLKVYREDDTPPSEKAPPLQQHDRTHYLEGKPPSAIWPLSVAITSWRKMTASGKPRGFLLWDVPERAIDSWIAIPAGVAEALHGRHSDFHRIGDLRGVKRLYASEDASELFYAKAVGATGWHIEGNLSGLDTLKRAQLFLKHFDHDPDELKLTYG